jgi:hypothetical protein
MNWPEPAILGVVLTLSACAVNRPVALSPGPAAISDFFAAHRPTDVLVTDSSGHSQMVHDPQIDGDSLRGLRNRELPRLRLSIAVNKISGMAVPEFSAGRTVGLVGAIVAVAAVGVVILANGAKPVY